jgi:hypothetical protein
MSTNQQERIFTAYIDLSFLKRLLHSKPDPIDDLDEHWMDVWKNVFSFLRQHARIIIDGEQEEVLSSETLTRVLLSDGQTENVEFKAGISDQLDGGNSWLGEDPFSVFLFEECNRPLGELRKETGLLFLHHDDLDDRWAPLFQPDKVDLQGDDSSFKWEDLSQHARPLNSILVVDKYAYHQLASKSKFAQNLGGLMASLLPGHTPAHPIHITIFTGLQKAIDDGRQISDLFETARDFLDDRFDHLDIQLRLLGFDEDQHEDRFLFTNYGFFFSGDSFEYFREDGTLQKNTLVKYLPLKGHEPEVLRRLKRFGEISFSPPVGFDPRDGRIPLAEGEPGNRLLDWVQSRSACD